MTPSAAVFAYLKKQLACPVVSVTSIPEKQSLPFASVALAGVAFGDGQGQVTLRYWGTKQAGEAAANAAAKRLRDALGLGGVRLGCDGGFVLLRRGVPFSQPIDTDSTAIGRLINLTIESYFE